MSEGSEMIESTRSRAKARDVTRSLQEGFVLIAPDGSLSFATDRARQLLGYEDRDELEAEWEEVRRRLTDAIDESERRTGRRPVRFRGEGYESLLEVRRYTIDEDECTSTLLLMRDYQCVRHAEAGLFLGSQMQQSARRYRSLAHDLKTPLNAIVITLDVLESELGAAPPEVRGRLLDHVKTIQSEVGRVGERLDMIQGLFTVPKQEWSELDLRDCIRDSVASIAAEATKEGVEIDLDLPDDPMTLDGYVDHFRRILENLLSNAVAAAALGARRVRVAAESSRDEASILVEDDGPGIPVEIADRIFEWGVTSKTDGTGIGLYVVRAALELYEGTVRVESPKDEGGGARFVIRVPWARGGEADRE